MSNQLQSLLGCESRNLMTSTSYGNKSKSIVSNGPSSHLSKKCFFINLEYIYILIRHKFSLYYIWINEEISNVIFTCLLVYQGVQSSTIPSPNFLSVYLVEVTGITAIHRKEPQGLKSPSQFKHLTEVVTLCIVSGDFSALSQTEFFD